MRGIYIFVSRPKFNIQFACSDGFNALPLCSKYKALSPNIVTIALQDQQDDRAERRQSQICEACLVVKPETQAGVKLANFGYCIVARYNSCITTTARPSNCLLL